MQVLARRRGMTLIELLVVLTIVGILTLILFPVSTRHRYPRRESCQANLKQIGLAFMQYVQDYNEQFPRVALNPVSSSVAPFDKPFGWVDGLCPYLKNEQIFQCPSETQPQSQDATRNGFTDYWMNTNLAGKKLERLEMPAMTFLGGEGNDGRDTTARYNRNAIPKLWITRYDSPARRHIDTGNYLYADGHVKALSPQLPGATFALK